MGAYYKAINIKDQETLSPSLTNDFLKLMEHGYIGNAYVNVVLNEIYEGSWKNKPVSWVSDYDTGRYKSHYNKSQNIKSCAENMEWLDFSDAIIINNTKKEYIDLTEHKLGWLGDRKLMTNPFVLLTTRSKTSLGGGDYYPENENRGRWSANRFVVTFNKFDVPSNYKNITKDVYFYENEEEIAFSKDAFAIKAKLLTKNIDKETRVRKLADLDENADKSEVIEFLKHNKSSDITFFKTNGDKVTRTAALLPDYDSSSSSDLKNHAYLWFYDLIDEKLKKMVFKNFVSIKATPVFA